MSDVQTPLTEADARYKKLRRKRRNLNLNDRVWYNTLRYLRNHTKQWRASRKGMLMDMAGESLEATKKVLADWAEFHDWLTGQSNSVGQANQGGFQMLCNRVDQAVARVQDVVDDYADDESPMETVAESIVAAALPLGLEPYTPWEEADDGAVWFVNPDTGNKHYFLLGQHHEGWPFEIMSRPIKSYRVERGWDQWEQIPALNLDGSVLVWSNPNLTHPARWLDAYFGMYNGLGIVERDVPESVDRALSKLRRIKRVRAD